MYSFFNNQIEPQYYPIKKILTGTKKINRLPPSPHTKSKKIKFYKDKSKFFYEESVLLGERKISFLIINTLILIPLDSNRWIYTSLA